MVGNRLEYGCWWLFASRLGLSNGQGKPKACYRVRSTPYLLEGFRIHVNLHWHMLRSSSSFLARPSVNGSNEKLQGFGPAAQKFRTEDEHAGNEKPAPPPFSPSPLPGARQTAHQSCPYEPANHLLTSIRTWLATLASLASLSTRQAAAASSSNR